MSLFLFYFVFLKKKANFSLDPPRITVTGKVTDEDGEALVGFPFW